MPKLWRIRPHDPDQIAYLTRAAQVPAVVAQLLIGRGLHDPQAATDFLTVKLSQLREPEQLPGVPEAAARLHRAVAEKRRIVIYGDYDVDGVSGTSLLWQCLKMLGGDVGYYVPHRLEEGYGLNLEAVRNLHAEGAQVIVTVDCGITSVAEAQLAAELGLELIISDHHEPGPQLPAAAAVVHPRLPGHNYPFTGLSGAGVAFKLAWAVCQCASEAKKVGPAMKQFLMQALALAALGTVADVVPLVDENRVLVRHGLAALKHQPTLGLKTLLDVTRLSEKSELASDDIGFTLAPRINAAGRLGQARLAVELLTTTNAARARELAEYIEQLNDSRQSLERSIQLAATKQAQTRFDLEHDAALVLADHDWHPGVIGIVAGRLAEKYHRPVILVALDKLGVKPGIGSARSVPGFNLHRALAACSQHLVSHGGHAAAAGLKIESQCLESFQIEFCEYAAQELSSHDRVAELWIDAETTLSALTSQTVAQIESMAPFGQGNPRPLLCASEITLAEPAKTIGGGGRHLALKLAQHGTLLRAVAFGAGERLEELANPATPLSIAFRPVFNEFRGRRTVELQVVDWRVEP